jgi:repressor LexA
MLAQPRLDLSSFTKLFSKPMPPTPPPSKTVLTRPQQKVLDAILFFQRKGELPTVREIGALVGLRSSATVFKHLQALERAKIISITTGKSRGIRITDPSLLKGSAPVGLSIPATSTMLPPNATILSRARSDGPQPFVPVVGAIAAGLPFESYAEGFLDDSDEGSDPADLAAQLDRAIAGNRRPGTIRGLPLDPRLFGESGDIIALQIKGDSMIEAGILDGDYAIIRRQNTVEEGDIAAVIINGEGTLKRWHVRSRPATPDEKGDGATNDGKIIRLTPENEHIDPIEITEDDAKDVLIFGKYIGLVRGNLQLL